MRRIVSFFAILQAVSLFILFPAIAATPPVVTEFATPDNGSPQYIASATADGSLWFTEGAEIGRITTSGAFTYFPASGQTIGITLGPDGALWFTEPSSNLIGRITTTGQMTQFQVPTSNSYPYGITAGPDGALWFVESTGNKVGRITTSGIFTEFPTGNVNPYMITSGPDGALWFTEDRGNAVARITTSGTISTFALPTANSHPFSITPGADGALWFIERGPSKIGRITTTGVLTEIPFSSGAYGAVTLGADGAIWVPDTFNNEIARIVITGASPTVTEYNIPTNNTLPTGITSGPDGALWFTEEGANQIGRITVPTNTLTVTQTSLSGGGQGQVTSSSLGQASLPGIACMTSGVGCSFNFPAGNLVTLTATAAQGSVFAGWSGGGCSGTGTCAITLTSDTLVTATFEPTPTTAMVSVTRSGNGSGSVTSDVSGIACGSTCNASFALNKTVTFSAFPASGSTFIGWSGGGCSGIQPCSVAFTQATTVEQSTVINANFVANSSSDITLVSALLPASRSVQVGSAATFFGTMINASTDTAGANCTVATTTNISATFSFQTTNSATNALTGTANTPVTIGPGASQSFILAITPLSPFSPTDVAFSFTCTNAMPAASNKGVNTLLLSASTTPIPDIIALVATASNDGILNIPGVSGTGAFAVATANVGATGAIIASANSGTANLPAAITICQTNPISGQCLASPAASVTTSINAGDTPTFAIFVTGSGTVPFQPGVNRIFVQFQDAGGVTRGSTSVAVRTQ